MDTGDSSLRSEPKRSNSAAAAKAAKQELTGSSVG